MIASRLRGLNLASCGRLGCMMRRRTFSTFAMGPDGTRQKPKAAMRRRRAAAIPGAVQRSRPVRPVKSRAGEAQIAADAVDESRANHRRPHAKAGRRDPLPACAVIGADPGTILAAVTPDLSGRISAHELAQGDAYVAQMSAALEANGLPGSCIELEITERVLMEQEKARLEAQNNYLQEEIRSIWRQTCLLSSARRASSKKPGNFLAKSLRRSLRMCNAPCLRVPASQPMWHADYRRR